MGVTAVCQGNSNACVSGSFVGSLFSGQPNKTELPDFQTRCTLGLSGRPWVTFKRDSSEFATEERTKVQLTERFGKQNSLSLITAGNLLVEVFEQTRKEEQSLTKTTLKIIDEESAQIVDAKDWEVPVKSLPAGSIRHGKPGFPEGDWGKPYAARFEVWFKPGSGQRERKLLERTFRIEGWMR